MLILPSDIFQLDDFGVQNGDVYQTMLIPCDSLVLSPLSALCWYKRLLNLWSKHFPQSSPNTTLPTYLCQKLSLMLTLTIGLARFPIQKSSGIWFWDWIALPPCFFINYISCYYPHCHKPKVKSKWTKRKMEKFKY